MREKSTSFKSLFGGLFAIGLVALFAVFQFNLVDLSMLPSFDRGGELPVVAELGAVSNVQILNTKEDVGGNFQLASAEPNVAMVKTASIQNAVAMAAGPPCDVVDCAGTGMPFTVVASCFAIPEAGEYGYIAGGDQTHVSEIEYCFDGQSGDVIITFEAWDIDNPTEASIYVNGQFVINIPKTPALVSAAGVAGPDTHNQWTGPYTIVIPDAIVNDVGTNSVIFTNNSNPPNSFIWGIRNVDILAGNTCFAIPEAGEYGKITGGDQNHVNEIEYCFDGQSGDIDITFEAWDIDFSSEASIYINGQFLTNIPTVPSVVTAADITTIHGPDTDGVWTGPYIMTIPDLLVNDASTNTIIFNNNGNPPGSWLWGIRQVDLLNASQVAASSFVRIDIANASSTQHRVYIPVVSQ